MFVQDPTSKSPGKNITAEISKEEANNFIKLCNIFASRDSHDKTIEEYVMKSSQLPRSSTAMTGFGLNRLPSYETVRNVSPSKALLGDPANSTSVKSGGYSHVPISTNLTDVINIADVIKFSQIEMGRILSRPMSRISSEQEMIDKFSFLLKAIDSDITVTPHGSVTYGFGGQKTDFNIQITTGKLV